MSTTLPRAALDNTRPYSVKLAEGQFLRLVAIKRRTGVPVPEQIRRAIEAHLGKEEKSK